MKYTFIVQDDGLHVVADCLGAAIVLAEGPTTIGLISSKGIVTEVHKGRLIGKEFLHDDPCYGVSH